jgi:hypothetical protein
MKRRTFCFGALAALPLFAAIRRDAPPDAVEPPAEKTVPLHPSRFKAWLDSECRKYVAHCRAEWKVGQPLLLKVYGYHCYPQAEKLITTFDYYEFTRWTKEGGKLVIRPIPMSVAEPLVRNRLCVHLF